MKTLFQRYTPLQIAIHIYAWSVLVFLVYDLITGNMSANPIQELEQRTGRHAITLLILSLACTPLNNIFGWRELIKRRRALGLYAFMYATIHIIIFVNLDYGFAWSLIVQTIIEKPYIVFGLLGFLMLIPLAATSFNEWKRRLGKNWKRLHQTIYFIVPVLLLHYALGKKGDIFILQGDIIRPLIYSLIAGILLILRIPPVRRFIASLSIRRLLRLRKRDAPTETITP
ncbi:MAG: protein-methionine-sulfoxide reductase heme-binding subunit MsrQ [Anaerolineales bacterium]|nr:MAG: protein-methionine-sulfoxide reductase heme-binding subunit MsrQ [Anaerolineales bacterium]